MIRPFIILLLLLMSQQALAQQFAEFKTDTNRFIHYYDYGDGQGRLPPEITEQYWLINGQKMTYGSGTIKVKVDANKLDTILYMGYRRSAFDTIICNISEAKSYTFYHNDCCGAFDVQDDATGKFIRGQVIYQLKSASKSNTYLGTLGEAGILVSKQTDTLKVHCRSAMSPNTYPISFRQIEICRDSLCKEGICLQEEGKGEPNWDFGYKTISTKMSFLFMPLKSKPLIIIYDPKTDSIEIK
ncbi:MAG: hypothetical protein MI810_10140 [Flavobacteriales bacterium]|nr:hypothetical protein [Flavobacteriales bacterium]